MRRESRLLAQTQQFNIALRNYAYHTKAIDVLKDKLDDFSGKACFIVGGGPSLSDCPVSDLSHHTYSIGVNKSFLRFKTTILFSIDYAFWDILARDANLMHKYRSSTPYRMMASPQIYGHSVTDDVAFVPRQPVNKRSVNGDISKGVYFSNNSGFAALMLAIALKFNPIYLLGYDFYTSEDKSHWHEGYEGQTAIGLSGRFADFLRPFYETANDVKSLGVRVYNLSKNSNLHCYPFLDRDEVFKLKNMT